MKKNEIIYRQCDGILREITVHEVKKIIKNRFGKETDSWNDFWMTIKLLFPLKIELYERHYQFLVVVDDKEGENEEERLETILACLNHLTLVKSFITKTDEGKLVYIAP